MIRHGHEREAIPRYTRRQIDLFHREAEQAERDARADRIGDIAAALSKDGNQIAKELRRPNATDR